MVAKENIYRNTPEFLTQNFDPYSVQMLKESDIPSDDTLPEPDYVDLGLPSGTLWATKNIGAESEEDVGKYYMYGKGAREYHVEDSAYLGNEEPLNSQYDTATQILGSDWRMPTISQFNELVANTTKQWINSNGKIGMEFTSTVNGNKIFIPASGSMKNGELVNESQYAHLWSSTPYPGFSSPVSAGFEAGYYNYREYTETVNPDRTVGFPVRAVKDSN